MFSPREILGIVSLLACIGLYGCTISAIDTARVIAAKADAESGLSVGEDCEWQDMIIRLDSLSVASSVAGEPFQQKISVKISVRNKRDEPVTPCRSHACLITRLRTPDDAKYNPEQGPSAYAIANVTLNPGDATSFSKAFHVPQAESYTLDIDRGGASPSGGEVSFDLCEYEIEGADTDATRTREADDRRVSS